MWCGSSLPGARRYRIEFSLAMWESVRKQARSGNVLSLCMLCEFSCFCCCLLFFFSKLTFSKYSFRSTQCQMVWIIIRTNILFWLRNKKYDFQLHTLIWRPAKSLCMHSYPVIHCIRYLAFSGNQNLLRSFIS